MTRCFGFVRCVAAVVAATLCVGLVCLEMPVRAGGPAVPQQNPAPRAPTGESPSALAFLPPGAPAAQSPKAPAPSAASASTAQVPAGSAKRLPVLEIPTEGRHPRLWVGAADVKELQGWAHAQNPAWTGFHTILQTSVTHYTHFFPGGKGAPADKPANPFPDLGDSQGYGTFKGSNVPTAVECHAFVLALGSLLTKNEQERAKYAGMARNLILYALRQVAQGLQKGVPFRDTAFATYNRGKGIQKFPLVVDWIYPYLSAEDKATIRAAFLNWSQVCLTASTTGGDHPTPVGVINDKALLPNGKPYRMCANNYYISHACALTHMSLCLDLTDDDEGQLRSYLANATGAWLYQMYGMFGDAEQVCADLGLKNVDDFGLASGGFAPEGPALYGESLGWMFEMFLALQTSGCTEAKTFGPQIRLLTAPFASRHIQAYLSWVDATPTTMKSWQGPVYPMPGFGDCLVLYTDPRLSSILGPLAVLQARQGVTSNQNAIAWAIQNLPPGGAAAFPKRMTNPWTYGPQQTVLAFLALDPHARPATDPRPDYPPIFIDQKQGTLIARHGHSACFFRCCWTSINHQQPDAGSFGLCRNGEWITKPISNYDNKRIGINSMCLNTLSVQNLRDAGDPPKSFHFYNDYLTGSQYWLDAGQSDPQVTFSHGDRYVHARSDFTGLYNRIERYASDKSADKVSQVQRLFLWLPEHDLAVTYDRVASRAGLFKRWNNASAKPPEIQGAVAVSESANGKQTYTVQTLLPARAKSSAADLRSKMNKAAEGEAMTWVLTVDDADQPAVSRFLHVLQATDPGTAAIPATLVQSQEGTPLEGAIIGSTAVLFVKNADDKLQSSTLDLPAGVTEIILMGVAPNAKYTVRANAGRVLVTAGPGVVADEAGLVLLEL
ncbi:MAG: hypothetical protein JSS02_23330 [Planctomycetes bacterium]|nr:hypothetical protein [Planctomycetota bacterium]